MDRASGNEIGFNLKLLSMSEFGVYIRNVLYETFYIKAANYKTTVWSRGLSSEMKLNLHLHGLVARHFSCHVEEKRPKLETTLCIIALSSGENVSVEEKKHDGV